MQVVVSRDQIAKRVEELGSAITRDYKGKELVIVGILRGACIFLADLIRAIDLPVTLDFMEVASYQGVKSSGSIRILKDITTEVEGKDLLIVEDIVDTGLTLAFVIEYLGGRQPRSMKVCALALKSGTPMPTPSPIHYLGFRVPDGFLVGYGLDLDQKYRNLRDLCILCEEKELKR